MSEGPREVDPSNLDDTVADVEVDAEEASPLEVLKSRAPTRPPAQEEPPKKAQSPRAQRPPPERMSDTVVDGAARRKADEVDLTNIFDRLTGGGEDNPLARYDPEAGRTNVAVKLREATAAVSTAVKGAVTTAFLTPFGRLLMACAIGLAGIALTIAAITIRDRWIIGAAAVVGPLGALLVYWRYQAWLGHKRYIFRLLETLGEDMSAFDPRLIYRRGGETPKRKRRR